jgi:transcription-repair coupling factor (superfamily II helicase)
VAGAVGIAKIQAGAESGSIKFAERSNVDPRRLLALIEGDPSHYRLDGSHKLKFFWSLEQADKRIAALDKLLRRLAPPASAAAAA